MNSSKSAFSSVSIIVLQNASIFRNEGKGKRMSSQSRCKVRGTLKNDGSHKNSDIMTEKSIGYHGGPVGETVEDIAKK